MKPKTIYMFRNKNGGIKKAVEKIEGTSFRDTPLDFFILLARYKFAARLLEKQHRVIDAGGGSGLGAVFLSKFCKQVIAVDYDAELVAHNQKEFSEIKNLEFKTLNLLKVPKNFPRFDALVSMDVVEHFPIKDSSKIVKNYVNLIKPGGFAVIGTPSAYSQSFASQRRLDSHFHEFEPDEFKSFLSKYFKNVFLFSMTDEVVSLTFPKMAWYLMALCIK
ncbi:MAG: class I SAM-dependent methyltransferase [Deltaproteobacteria bacterium]|nr:class I SAM-dependent methyltransferase [Deltaproteobacteria bacterium]